MIRQPLGHSSVLHRLTNLLDRERLAHALLFTGPDGIGKSAAAQWLTAYSLCRSPRERPCGTCESCTQVSAGAHPDHQRIGVPEGKKEIGIDAIRQLKRYAMMSPTAGRRKLVIIDECDRLSVAAQNALLKTLEEPPGQCLLLLVTARPGSLLPTVRSRCQRILFAPLQPDDVVAVLTDAGVPEPEMQALVRIADGSPGRALAWKTIVSSGVPAELEGLLADLNPARYVSILRFAGALGKTELDMTKRLEMLQLRFATEAASGVRTSDPDNDWAPFASLHAIDSISRALFELRRRNANRSLLAEVVGIELAKQA